MVLTTLFNLIISLLVGLLVSFFGLILGVILSRIAVEEILPGKKYFYLLKRVVFILAGLVLVYYLIEYRFLRVFSGHYGISTWLFIPLSLILYSALFISEIKFKKFNPLYLALLNYSLLILSYLGISYLLMYNLEAKLVFASLIFLYGFPVGTILWPAKKI